MRIIHQGAKKADTLQRGNEYPPEIQQDLKLYIGFIISVRDTVSPIKSSILSGALYAIGHSSIEPISAVVVYIPDISLLNSSTVNANFASVRLQALPAP